jgi:hypothetical protein
MAICSHCGGEMSEGISCLTDPVVIGGKAYYPVRWGQESRRLRHRYEPEERRACGTPLGGVHHPGCIMERCPVVTACGCVTEPDDVCATTRATRCRSHVPRRAGWR